MKSIHIVEKTLPMAWEKAVIACWEQGERFPTQYDKPEDPNSRDVTAMIHVTEPMSEPRLHRAFPGGLDDLEKYRDEVLLGVHDHWIAPQEGKWEYTYHERLFEYDPPWAGGGKIDQIATCVRLLKDCWYTRRAQAVTWKAWEDLGISDPACLQRMWFRIQNGRLNMNVHMRSNDAYKAAFMNMFAFVELQAQMARDIGVVVGEYIHIADSFHIYGSYFEEFQGFLKTVENRAVGDRVWDTGFAREMFIEGCDVLLAEQDMPQDKKELVRKRRAELTATG
ncbi:MAG TPA: thymidylate synthase [Phycisphaerae bacterium]|nr:thymidylate synthase [Phycisphaerae bacterium]HRR85600.1 thymidylate synthase [Phycisphaerae bacterium]